MIINVIIINVYLLVKYKYYNKKILNFLKKIIKI